MDLEKLSLGELITLRDKTLARIYWLAKTNQRLDEYRVLRDLLRAVRIQINNKGDINDNQLHDHQETTSSQSSWK